MSGFDTAYQAIETKRGHLIGHEYLDEHVKTRNDAPSSEQSHTTRKTACLETAGLSTRSSRSHFESNRGLHEKIDRYLFQGLEDSSSVKFGKLLYELNGTVKATEPAWDDFEKAAKIGLLHAHKSAHARNIARVQEHALVHENMDLADHV